MKPYTFLAAVLLCMLLAACGSLGDGRDQYWLKTDAPLFPSAVESLIAYHAYVWNLSAAELARENEIVRAAVARSPGEFQRLRQAMVAAAPAGTVREHARAQQLVEQLERDVQKSSSQLKSIVALLRAELSEHRRLEDRLRDETRRADDLEQKMDALKEIEKNLLDRRHPKAAPK